MASTGITVPDASITDFNEFKKSNNPLRFIILKIEEGRIVTEHQGNSTNFEDFLALLPAKDGRYVVYKMSYTTADGRPGEKLASISWVPDAAPVKTKMIYAGSKDAVNRVFIGISVKMHATDLSELTVELIQDACRKF